MPTAPPSRVTRAAPVLATCVKDFRPDVEGRVLFTARCAHAGHYYALGYVLGGGLNMGWFRSLAAADLAHLDDAEAFARLDAEAAEVPPGAEGLVFAPHLSGRVTPNDPHQRGLWHGLTRSHGRGHLYRSLLEGIAFEYGVYLRATRRLHPQLAAVEVRAVGGGARSTPRTPPGASTSSPRARCRSATPARATRPSSTPMGMCWTPRRLSPARGRHHRLASEWPSPRCSAVARHHVLDEVATPRAGSVLQPVWREPSTTPAVLRAGDAERGGGRREFEPHEVRLCWLRLQATRFPDRAARRQSTAATLTPAVSML